LTKIFVVEIGVTIPFRGYVIFRENSCDWADWFTRGAVNAFFGADQQHFVLFCLIYAVYRTNVDASPIKYVNTWFSDDISHLVKEASSGVYSGTTWSPMANLVDYIC